MRHPCAGGGAPGCIGQDALSYSRFGKSSVDLAKSRGGGCMNFIAKFAWAALAIALVANADTPGKASSSSEGTSTPFSRPESGWSGWAFVPLERDGVVSLRKTKDFHDTQFQYRWKSE